MLGRPTLNDEILRAYIQQVFDKYDKDKSGGLDSQQLTLFFNDLFKTLNLPSSINEEHARAAIRSMDQNSDGTIDKKQLFDAFKLMMNRTNTQPLQNNINPYLHQPKPNMMGFNHPQHQFIQPPMQPNYPMPNNYAPNYQPNYTNQGWSNDPMIANMKSPFINNTPNVNNPNIQKPQTNQNPPQNYMGGMGMSTSRFGGGWSKRGM